MLDLLGADDAIERTIFERQCECGGIDQRHPIAAQEAKLGVVEIHANRVVESLHDETGTASGIEHAAGTARPRDGDMMTAVLPVTLPRGKTVEGMIVIVCRCDQSSKPPPLF